MMTEDDPLWTLMRQDDNGSTAVIAEEISRQEAESRLEDLEARGHKQHYWIEPSARQEPTRLNLVVIRSQDMNASKKFYQRLGLSFEKHRHGKGAEHYAAELPGGVFEIYPAQSKTSEGARIGFAVAKVDAVVEAIDRAGYEVVSPPKDSPWGRRAVVADPDGHRVELTG